MENYDLTVKRDTVYRILQIADPEGVQARLGKRLKRREYKSPGPNFIFHVDGYDKLKPFGFSIHGAIDGFSRKIMWLELATTNKNPKVTAYYYLQTLKKLGYMPSVIRTDRGTENVWIEALHTALRSNHNDDFAGLRSYMCGKSTHNQRIESWWGTGLRKHTVDWYINLFKSMVSRNMFDGSDLHVECLRFSFGPVIKNDLVNCKNLWNQHKIRKQQGQNFFGGKPDVMYHDPGKFNARECKKEIDVTKIDNLIHKFTIEPQLFSPEFQARVERVYPEADLPTTTEEALELYKTILLKLRNAKYETLVII